MDYEDAAWEERYDFDDSSEDVDWGDQHDSRYPRDFEDEGVYFDSFADY